MITRTPALKFDCSATGGWKSVRNKVCQRHCVRDETVIKTLGMATGCIEPLFWQNFNLTDMRDPKVFEFSVFFEKTGLTAEFIGNITQTSGRPAADVLRLTYSNENMGRHPADIRAYFSNESGLGFLRHVMGFYRTRFAFGLLLHQDGKPIFSYGLSSIADKSRTPYGNTQEWEQHWLAIIAGLPKKGLHTIFFMQTSGLTAESFKFPTVSH